jgi:EAL domain-containing protein (putative c-di-GMP-specific phosphodiesterase class I)/GGDEF domain-containing protein
MIFSVNFVISVNNMRSYLQVESQVHAQDTATSLGLSLSPYITNESDPILKTMMSAIFDMGYYKELKLVNVSNKPLVTLTNDKVFEEIPNWFIGLLPMETATAESEISAGWSLGGVIYVTINPGYAYLKLYQQAKNAFWYSLAAFIFSVTLLILMLRLTLLPLKKINQLALTIANGQFQTIDALPWTTEVRNVALSMNIMSGKLGGIMKSLNAKLESLGRKLKIDELTGLNKKSSFDSDMKQLFLENIDAFLFLIKIDSLSMLVKEQASATIDVFLQDCASTIKHTVENSTASDASAYHFFGGEFAVLARKISFQQAEQLASLLSKALADLGEKIEKKDIAHIGVAPFNALSSASNILAATNEAFEQSKLIGANSYYIRAGGDQAKDIDEWKSLVFDIIDKDAYRLAFIGQIEHFQTGEVMMEEAFIQVFDNRNESLAIGTFISIAEKFEKILDLDKGVINKVIHHLVNNNIQHAVAVNISTRTVKSSDFRSWLTARLQKHQAISNRIVFSISAYAVAKDFIVYKEFIKFVHGFGAKVILKRFDAHAMTVDMAKALKPDYIRLSRELCNGISTDIGKQAFVETSKDVCDLLDIGILGENILSESDYSAVKSIGLIGASR